MKPIVYWAGPGHIDIVGKITIRTEQPASRRSLARRIKMDDLPGCMHAGVRATRTAYVDGVVGNLLQCIFNTRLYTVARALSLPAVVRRAVVLDAQSNTHMQDS